MEPPSQSHQACFIEVEKGSTLAAGFRVGFGLGQDFGVYLVHCDADLLFDDGGSRHDGYVLQVAGLALAEPGGLDSDDLRVSFCSGTSLRTKAAQSAV